MALIGSMTKQPSEILPIDIDYAAVIGGRTVSSLVCVVTEPSGMTLVSQQVVGQTLQIYVSSGLTATTYRWIVQASITIGGKVTLVEDEIDVVVLAI